MPRHILGWVLVIAAIVVLVVAFRSSKTNVELEPSVSDIGVDGAVQHRLPPEVDGRFIRLVSNMWWHRDDLRDSLGLSDEQIQKMDAICLELLRSRWARRKIEQQQKGAYLEALAELDLEAAERALDARERRAVGRAVGVDRMTLRILHELTPEQLETVGRDLPMLLRRPWLKGVTGSMQRRSGEDSE